MKTYSEKLKDPRWQKKRLEILQRDEWKCRSCSETEKTLHVHHRFYKSGAEPWDYPSDTLVTLCCDCHESETEEMKEYLPLLLEQLARLFDADDLRELAYGFSCITPGYCKPHILATALQWTLQDHEKHVDFYLAEQERYRRERQA